MQDHIATDPVLPTHGAKIVAMFVIVRIMLFVMAQMESVLALLGILVKSKSNRIIILRKNTSTQKITPLQIHIS